MKTIKHLFKHFIQQKHDWYYCPLGFRTCGDCGKQEDYDRPK